MSKRKTHEEFVSEIGNRPIRVLNKYINSNTKLEFQCEICGAKWKAVPFSVSQGSGCPPCGRKNGWGKLEKTNDIIEDHGDWLLIDISTDKHKNSSMAVDTDVWDNYNSGRVYAIKYAKDKYIYAKYSEKRKPKSFHHVVIDKVDGVLIDHIIHGDSSFIDNRRSNLRYATNSQNTMNQGLKRTNNSGKTGVHFNKRRDKWVSTIYINGKLNHLGYFDNIDIAIGVRQQAEREHFGEYAYDSHN